MSTQFESLLIRGGRVLRGDLATTAEADLLVERGWIAAIEPAGTITREGRQVFDASDRLLIPGLVNAHTHGHGALAKGLIGDRVPLEVFLNANGAVNGNRTVEDKRLTAKLSAVELVRKGCTACYDLFAEFPAPSREGLDAVAEAYAEVGIRAVVAPMMADRTLFEALPGLIESLPDPLRRKAEALKTAPYEVSLEAARDVLTHWSHDRDRIRPAVAPTIPLHCSDDFMIGCKQLAAEFDVPLQTHLAETKAQAVLGTKRYGRSLTAHLESLGLIGAGFSAAHGIWLDDEDMSRLGAAGASVAHNPMSNLRLGSGVAAVRRLLRAGVNVGIGTDATNTSDGQNMFEAMRLAAGLSRIADPDPSAWLSVEEAFAAATTGSAAILGFDRVGRLEPGWRADIVFLDLAHINYVPLHSPLRQIVFAENGAAVASVMIDGRMILQDGQLTTIDEAGLRREVEAAAQRLDAANAAARAEAHALADLVGCFCLAHARQAWPVHRRLPDDQT